MGQMTLTQFGALGHVIGWTNFTQYMDSIEILSILLDLSTIYFAHFSRC